VSAADGGLQGDHLAMTRTVTRTSLLALCSTLLLSAAVTGAQAQTMSTPGAMAPDAMGSPMAGSPMGTPMAGDAMTMGMENSMATDCLTTAQAEADPMAMST